MFIAACITRGGCFVVFVSFFVLENFLSPFCTVILQVSSESVSKCGSYVSSRGNESALARWTVSEHDGVQEKTQNKVIFSCLVVAPSDAFCFVPPGAFADLGIRLIVPSGLQSITTPPLTQPMPV